MRIYNFQDKFHSSLFGIGIDFHHVLMSNHFPVLQKLYNSYYANLAQFIFKHHKSLYAIFFSEMYCNKTNVNMFWSEYYVIIGFISKQNKTNYHFTIIPLCHLVK